MKWFKHDSDASMDAKLKRLRIRYGLQGYGLYWYCLELVARNVDKHNLTFELEHDAEIIAHDNGMHFDDVEKMMRFMVELGLFETNDAGVVTCLKMASRTDEYTQQLMRKPRNSPEKLPRVSRETPENVRGNRTEQNRTEETKGRRFTPPSLREVADYVKERGYRHVEPEAFMAFYGSKGWMVGRNKMKCWKSAVTGWETRSKSKPADNVTPITGGTI